ncbi:MAG TPA: methyltransferase domain-containing protein [Anaerolineales bacterium]|nr:methyltransferase domain-containing protein [Anaerolineales bacterium]
MNDKEHIIETFTELAPRYEEVVNAELNRFWGWSYTGFVNRLIQMTPVSERGRLLDLATGTGVIPIKVITEKLSLTPVYGLDITRSMLIRARQKIIAGNLQNKVDLVCASAMEIPYASESFDLVTCALATHHMNVKLLLSETYRILYQGGMLSIADVGGSDLWKLPIVKFFLRIAAFVYFLIKEDINRAWAEADAVSNVRSKEEWSELLIEAGFQDIKITKLRSKHRWIPEPLVIQAIKHHPGGYK